MNKVCRIGTIKIGGRWASVYIKASVTDGRLSVSGVIGPLASGNALGGCGQIDMEFSHRNPTHNDRRYSNPIQPKDINFAPGWNVVRWYKLLEVWHDWHLNDMIAGCEHQEFEKSLGHKYEAWPHNLDAICPECGYSYGSRWNSKKLPKSVTEFIAGLPSADKTPAWV